MRTITIISTKNVKINKVESAATTWGELVEQIGNQYDLSKLKATEGVNKTTLEHVDSILPEGDFKIFLRPSKVKSGAIDYKNLSFGELRSIAKSNENLKQFLSEKAKKAGKNWTQLTLVELRDFTQKFFNSAATATTVTEEKPKKNKAKKASSNTPEEAAQVIESSSNIGAVVQDLLKRVEHLEQIINQGGIPSEVVDNSKSEAQKQKEQEDKEREEAEREIREFEAGLL